MTTGTFTSDPELRKAAIDHLRKKREFWQHAFVFVVINVAINLIWLFTTPGGFYWPMFPLFGWGIGLAFHAWDVYAPTPVSEERIQREIERLTRR